MPPLHMSAIAIMLVPHEGVQAPGAAGLAGSAACCPCLARCAALTADGPRFANHATFAAASSALDVMSTCGMRVRKEVAV